MVALAQWVLGHRTGSPQRSVAICELSAAGQMSTRWPFAHTRSLRLDGGREAISNNWASGIGHQCGGVGGERGCAVGEHPIKQQVPMAMQRVPKHTPQALPCPCLPCAARAMALSRARILAGKLQSGSLVVDVGTSTPVLRVPVQEWAERAGGGGRVTQVYKQSQPDSGWPNA